MTSRPLGALALTLATWWGCGLSPVAPGTVGTLGALPLYFLLRGYGPAALLAAAVVLGLVGVWASGHVARTRRLKDPQIVVIDEVTGVLIALAAAPNTANGIAAAVLLFRFFDISKPYPAKDAEALPRGWGIMLDDVAAGVWAAVFVIGLRSLGVLAS